MVMANYSVFYYLARASVVILTEPHLFPEDAFIFLRVTTENAAQFLNSVRTLADELPMDPSGLPDWNESDETISAIRRYRNAFSHAPRLGRNSHLDWEFIPVLSQLNRAEESWGYVQRLPSHCFEDGRIYLQKLRVDLMRVLDPIWKQTRDVLDAQRSSEAYLRLYRLDSSGKPLPRQQK
jgi:hypothetical protein